LRAIAVELVEFEGGLVELKTRRRPSNRIPPRLLPAFDPYLLGWKDRSFAVPLEFARRVHPGTGIVRAVATVDRLAVGTWRARRVVGRVAVELDTFAPISAKDRAALEREAADVQRFDS
jgi:hypothetical protein